MTITDDVVAFVRNAGPRPAEVGAAAGQLAAIRAAVGREGQDSVAHPAGKSTAMNAAWQLATAAAASGPDPDGSGWPMVGATVVALQGDSASDEQAAADAVAVGTAVARWIVDALDSTADADRWSRVGVAGRIGAGAAAGRLLGLEDEQVRNLLGLCATQAAGLRSVDESPTGALQAAKAAADAVEAALLAQCGFTSSVDGFGGRRGLFALVTPDVDGSRRSGPAWATDSGR
jgi:hypothetical protein